MLSTFSRRLKSCLKKKGTIQVTVKCKSSVPSQFWLSGAETILKAAQWWNPEIRWVWPRFAAANFYNNNITIEIIYLCGSLHQLITCPWYLTRCRAFQLTFILAILEMSLIPLKEQVPCSEWQKGIRTRSSFSQPSSFPEILSCPLQP